MFYCIKQDTNYISEIWLQKKETYESPDLTQGTCTLWSIPDNGTVTYLTDNINC